VQDKLQIKNWFLNNLESGMKLQLLPSTFDEQGVVSPRQHLSCFIIDDCVAIDAGSLAMSTTAEQKNKIRDIILTHAHLDQRHYFNSRAS
jgi:hypothetical protein